MGSPDDEVVVTFQGSTEQGLGGKKQNDVIECVRELAGVIAVGQCLDRSLEFCGVGGECFGEAGRGFLRLSCAEPNERLREALEFLPVAFSRIDRVNAFLASHAEYRLPSPYGV